MPSITVATATAVNDTAVGSVAWSNVSNVTSSNNSRATVALGYNQISNYIRCKPASLSSIPASATIDGIVVSIERSSTVSMTVNDGFVRLYKSSTSSYVGANRGSATKWPTSDGSVNCGGALDLWGTTWTRSEVINNLEVGIVAWNNVPATSSTAQVDYVEFTIHYTLQQNISAPFLNNGITFFGPSARVQGFTMPLLSIDQVFYDHSFAFIQTLEAPFLDAETVFYEHRFGEGISAPFVEFAPTFYGPSMAFPQEMDCPYLDNGTTLYGFEIFNTWHNTDDTTSGIWTDVDTPL
jgi:hypothetical protein